MSVRYQLTLFVRKSDSGVIEAIRESFNPDQYKLIASHVTLCREDEIDDLPVVTDRLRQVTTSPIRLEFGQLTRFAEGKGVLLPVVGVIKGFHDLRRNLLQGIVPQVALAKPHLTLMHPRNSTCTDECFRQLQNFTLPSFLVFDTVSLIKQTEENPWELIQQFSLGVN